jgi:glycosyltransferase involved in cell wall biosynthesis
MQMITVAYDSQIFLMQKRGGISRYFVELIKSFQQNPDLGINPVLINSKVINEYAISELQELGARDCSGILQPWRELFLSLVKPTDHNRWDVVHHTFYQKNFLKKYSSHVQAVTLYDMIPEITNARGRFGNPHLAKETYLNNCNLIFSISDSASTDAKRIYGLPDLQTHLTYLAQSQAFTLETEIQSVRDSRYILFVGNRDGYKQGNLLIEALAKLTDLEDLKLIFVGGGKFSESEQKLISKLKLTGRVSQENASDIELNDLYRQAELYVMPSLYEGFGIPALEAMAVNCPVLLSNTSSLPEVGGDAARYFTAGNKHSLSAAIREIVTKGDVKKAMVEAGKLQVSRFSWEKCAQDTANAYRMTLEANR